MSKRATGQGIIKTDGLLFIYDRPGFLEAVRSLGHPDHKTNVEIIIKIKDDNISHRQRKYFFGVIAKRIQERLNELGNTATQGDVVEWIKDAFMFREKLNKVTGKVIKSPISLSDSSNGLTKPEFQKVKEDIQRFCAEEMELIIPDPPSTDDMWTTPPPETGN